MSEEESLQAELERLKRLQAEERAVYAEERKAQVRREVSNLVTNRQLLAEAAPAAIVRAIADPTYLDELRRAPVSPPPLPSPLMVADAERSAPNKLNLTHYPLAGGEW